MREYPRTIVRKNNINYKINKKTYVINIDKISFTKYNDFIHSKPVFEKIEKLNSLYDEGHDIHYWTDRGSDGKTYNFLTYRQLHEWKVKYSSLTIGKPIFTNKVYEDI